MDKERQICMENKMEFQSFLRKTLKSFFKDSLLLNFKNQLQARKLKADFRHTYDFSYIWDKISVAITASCFLLKDHDEDESAVQSLKFIAEICENLSLIEDYNWDREYATIISALCYDLSGYQSNAFCVIRNLNEYFIIDDSAFDGEKETLENKVVFEQTILIVQKKIPYASHRLKTYDVSSERFSLLKEALASWYDNILLLKDSAFVESMHEAYRAYLYSGNVYLTKIIQLLELKIIISHRRSLIKLLGENGIDTSFSIWRKYLKILSNDFYGKRGVKPLKNRKSIYEFWVSQRKAIEQGLFTKNENFIVQMPTSAGKTFIAELFILNKLVNFPQKRCIYISPFRALATEKELDFGNILGKLGFSSSSVNGGFDQDSFQNIVYEHSDVMIVTPEKMSLFSRLDENFFDNISAIVVDEGHIIGEFSPRAALLEMLMCRIKIKVPQMPILFISAVMPTDSADNYAIWLSGNKENVLRSTRFINQEDWQPTRKIIGKVEFVSKCWRASFEDISINERKETAFINNFLTPNMYGKNCPKVTTTKKTHEKKSEDKISVAISLAYKLSETGNVLVFCGTVSRLEDVAKKICKLYYQKDSKLNQVWERNDKSSSYYYSHKYFGEEHWISKCLQIGVGIHFGDLPEMLRKTVEQDYKSGLLKVLLCTNTISQGVNLPIKYAIVHNTILNRINDKNICLSNRDFKNLIGRAGRAEFETEGLIFFVINTPADKKAYQNYIRRKNIEPANSIIFNLYSQFLSSKINKDEFLYLLSMVLDSDLIAEIKEEDWDSDFDLLSEKIIANTLFGTECSLKNIDTTQLKEGLRKKFFSIKKNAETFENLELFKKTGLSVDLNKRMLLFIKEENIDAFDIHNILNLFLSFFQNNDCSEIIDNEILPQNLRKNIGNILHLWIDGASIDHVKNAFFALSENDSVFLKFMSKGVDYLLPWIFSAFTNFIVDEKKDCISEEKSKLLNSYPLFLKYGLNDKLACLARSMGVLSREIAMKLSKESQARTEQEFISWIIKLEREDLDSLSLNEFDRANIEDVARKYNRNKEPSQKTFIIKGTRYNILFMKASLQIAVGEPVNFIRDKENAYDAFAIKIDSQLAGEIGFVPKDMAAYYAVEMDLNDKSFSGFVSKTIPRDGYNDIEVTVNQTSWYT